MFPGYNRIAPDQQTGLPLVSQFIGMVFSMRTINWIKRLLWVGAFCSTGAVMVASAAYLYLSPQLPPTESYQEIQLEAPLRILTADGRLIDEVGVRRDPIEFENMPPMMVNAVIASEDSRFYSHPGVDIRGLVRGFYGFVRGISLGGGSTITMPLANNISFEDDNVYERKLKEIPFALRLQQELSKEEILELYLNLVYFGGGAEGISAAANTFYGKPVEEMTLAQYATMASVLPCPSVCNPVADPSRAKRRRNVVLGKMRNQGMITAEQHAAAVAEPIEASRHLRRIEVDAPYVAAMVRQRMEQRYGEEAYRNGFEVTTGIRAEMQRNAQQALRYGLENRYDRRHGYRGPEDQLPVRGENPRELWQERLQSEQVYGNQHPAVVTAVGERSATVLMRDGTERILQWPALEWARPFVNRNSAWPPPEQASDVVARGDLVRIRRNRDGNWELGQVPAIQGALVSVSPDNGDIMALTGGYDFDYSQVNRALSERPPGSGFKPFLYGAALENGYSVASTINDAPFTRNGYRPQNFERNFIGPITLRNAFKHSRNVPAVRLYDQIGSEALMSFASRFGFDTGPFPRNDLTVALGSQDVQPLQMATAYAMIANGGYRVEPTLIKKIESFGEVVHEAEQPTVCHQCAEDEASAEAQPRAESVVDPRIAYILNTMLRSVVEEGSGARVARELDRDDLMGKTGTTNGPNELWFTGFNRDVATSVYVGFDDPEPLGESEQGATVAVPIWIDYMGKVLEERPEHTMERPDGLVERLVYEDSGKSAPPGAADTMFEVFLAERAPESRNRGNGSSDAASGEDELSTEILF